MTFPLPNRLRAFTLIEMLVMITIMSVLLGLVLTNYQPDDRQQLQNEGHKLALLLSYAINTSRATGQKIAWQPDKNSYQFIQNNNKENKWEKMSDDPTLKERFLPESIRFGKIAIGGLQAKQHEMIVFSPTGINSEFTITLLTEHSEVVISGDMLGHVTDATAQELH